MQPDLAPIRFAPALPLIVDALEAARIREPMTVGEAALKYVRLENRGGGYSGPYTFDLAPHLRRPMDCLTTDSGYRLVAVMGPSQCGKSKIGDVWQLYCVLVDPADIIAVWPDKDIARSYVTTQIDKMIQLSPELRDKQFHHPSADNIFSKRFIGSNWFHVWPVASQLRARPVPRFRVEDFDAVPEDIGGEGDVLVLLGGRQTIFEGFDVGYANSSPALGPSRGIEAAVAAGTDERWHVDCLHCATPFEMSADCLHFDRSGDVALARETAAVVCPHGCAHSQPEKRALMETGRWVGKGQAPVPGGIEGELAPNRAATFRMTGPMGFASWAWLAEILRDAEIYFDNSQDEGKLKAAYQSRLGVNYLSRIEGAEPITTDQLQGRVDAAGYPLGTVPPGAIVLTAAVDVQGNRFEVLVQAWGLGFESWVVDRFQILALADGQTAINPGQYSEHWQVLLQQVVWRRYPLQTDPAQTVAIASTAIDTGGAEGVTTNAFKFFYAAVAAGVPPDAITLIKGGNNPRARLLPAPTIDAKRKRAKTDPDAPLFVPNVNRFKSIVDVRLRRQIPGPAYIHLPAEMAVQHVAEIAAEELRDGLWQKKPGQANETWDLLVYNAVVMMRFSGADASLSWVPRLLRCPVQIVDAAPAAAAAEAPATVAPMAPPADHPHAARRRRQRGLRGRVEG